MMTFDWRRRQALRCAALLIAVVVSSPSAWAGPFGLRSDARQGDPGGRSAAARRNAERPAPPRDERRAEPVRPDRLSPDERRQLRRDVRDANREIYPARRR